MNFLFTYSILPSRSVITTVFALCSTAVVSFFNWSSICFCSVMSITIEAIPIVLPCSSIIAVLYQSQRMVFPSLVRFSFIFLMPPVLPDNESHMFSISGQVFSGRIKPIECLPVASSFEYPKIFSAALFHETTSKFEFHSMMPIGVSSK